MIAPLIHINVIYSIFIHDFAAQDQFNLVPTISIIIILIDIMYTCLIKHVDTCGLAPIHSYTLLHYHSSMLESIIMADMEGLPLIDENV